MFLIEETKFASPVNQQLKPVSMLRTQISAISESKVNGTTCSDTVQEHKRGSIIYILFPFLLREISAQL